jgi:uncharacterized protein YjbJ (UPF0337 family)
MFLAMASFPAYGNPTAKRFHFKYHEITILKENSHMSSDVFESKWQKLKGEIRSQWGKLTDDDLERIAGNKDKLIGVVQERYGYVWDEARQMVDRYLDDYNGLKTQATEALRAVASSENLHKFKTDVVDLVRRHPIPALLVGLGIGYLIARRNER